MTKLSQGVLLGVLAGGLSTVLVNAQFAPLPAPDPVPKIQFATNIYDFGRVKSGDMVKCVYYFTNTGNALLEVTGVQPQCGCTVVSNWTKTVEPGQSGIIPIQYNTAGYNGQVFKQITVTCNVTNQPMLFLQLKGTIWKPIDYSPAYAVMNVPPDMPAASTVVKVLNNTEEQVYLSPPDCNNRAFLASISTNTPGKEYQITVTTVGPLTPGTLQAQLTVKTTSTNAPVISIPIWLSVQPIVMVMPPQIVLPPPPLMNTNMPSVTIQNNSTNSLWLSEPEFNCQGVDMKLTSVQTGRVYTATFAFPPGFEVPRGQQVAFSVKTSHPQYPIIKVPVMQMPRPAPPNPAPVPASSTPAQPTPSTAQTDLPANNAHPLKPLPVAITLPPMPPDNPHR